MNKFEKEVVKKLDTILELLQNEKTKGKKLEFEDHNFRVSTEGWEKITVDDESYLVNEEEDIWEFLDGYAKGEQLFTWDSAMRETKKAGKKVPTDEELDILLKTKEDMPNLVYAGYRYPSGAFFHLGSHAYFWSSSQSSSTYAWRRLLYSSESRVYRLTFTKSLGFSVRCLK